MPSGNRRVAGGSRPPAVLVQYPEAGLLSEVARLQREATLLRVRDAMDSIALDGPASNYSYSRDARSAKEFKTDLLAALERLRSE